MPDAVCDVWWASPAAGRPWHRQLLDGSEQERRAQFRRDEDRERFTIGAALLRLAAARQLGIAAAEIDVDRTCRSCGRQHGAPRLRGAALKAGGRLFVSVSHSAERVAVALASTPVGVDVEQLVDLDLRSLAESVLHPDERSQVDDVAGLLTVWTRKEAVLKATGEGLLRPMAEVRVSGPRDPAALIGIAGRPDVRAELEDLSPGPGYVGAVAVLVELDQDVVVREFDATELLTVAPEGSGRSAR